MISSEEFFLFHGFRTLGSSSLFLEVFKVISFASRPLVKIERVVWSLPMHDMERFFSTILQTTQLKSWYPGAGNPAVIPYIEYTHAQYCLAQALMISSTSVLLASKSNTLPAKKGETPKSLRLI